MSYQKAPDSKKAMAKRGVLVNGGSIRVADQNKAIEGNLPLIKELLSIKSNKQEHTMNNDRASAWMEKHYYVECPSCEKTNELGVEIIVDSEFTHVCDFCQHEFTVDPSHD